MSAAIPSRTSDSRLFQEFGPVLRGERHGFLHEFCLLLIIEFRGRSRTSGDRYTDLFEKVLLTRRGADAKQANGPGRDVMELMGRVRGNIDGFACAKRRFLAPERRFDLTFQQNGTFPQSRGGAEPARLRAGCACRSHKIVQPYPPP